MSDRKTLLPELLPDPRPRSGQSPRERVAARARAMLERLAGLKTAVGAAVLAVHCGYGVVDPLPPPPAQCTTAADPLGKLWIEGGPVRADGGGTDASFTIGSAYAGLEVDAVRVTAGGTPIGTQDRTVAGGASEFDITILPDGSGGPILFEVDLGCGGATITKHYRATLDGIRYDTTTLD